MNAKYALALILILQVSAGLCEMPTPSQELADKYDSLRSVFLKRLLMAYGRLQQAAAPVVEKLSEGERGQAVKTYIEDLQNKPEFTAFLKVANGVSEETGPLVDKARTTLLGMYEEYLRPHIGNYLNDAIDNIKVYLNMVLPVE